MRIRRQLRRLVRGLLLLAVLVLIALATLPYWLEPAVRPLARRYGVTWSSASREGRSRLELAELKVATGPVRLDADAVTIKQPGVWLVDLLRRSDSPYIAVRNWELTIATRADKPAPSEDASDAPARDIPASVGRLWNRIARDIPVIAMSSGTIHLPDEAVSVQADDLAWHAGNLSGAVRFSPADGGGTITASLDAGLRWPSYGWALLTATLDGPMAPGNLPGTPALPATLTQGALRLHASWNRGPVRFKLEHTLAAELEDGLAVSVETAIEGGDDGIRFPALALNANGERILHASGHLPIVLDPGADPEARLHWYPDAPLRLQAETVPGAALWASLGRDIPAWPVNPVLTADIAGTRAAPLGRLHFRADRIDYTLDGDAANGLPAVSDIGLDVEFTEATAVLERLVFRVAGQAVELTARLPLGEAAWREFVTVRRLPHWSRLEGSLAIPGAAVAAFRSWFPASIAPAGHFSADIQFRPGGMLAGRVRLRDAATRPIMPIGVLSAINGDVTFDGRKLRLERLSGRLGERDVVVTGQADLTDDFDVRYTLHATGTGVPLVRRPGLMLRGDLDVTLTGMTGSAPFTRIGGSVDLKSGYFLSELRLPVPGTALTVPGQRPPYFSVETEPFADWELDLHIRGHEFMQVRSPVFTGLLSADFRVGGTLAEPVSPGAVEIDRGTMRFPFGTLTVERGRALLTPENPFSIEIDSVSSGRIFGYDVTMTLSGTDTEPVLEFTSTPPLSSDAILLMVTAGQLPEREIEFTGQQRAARLALFLGQNLLYELTGDENVGDRLLIESGRNISRSGRETYAIRYRLNDRFSVTGEYDEYDAINAGIRWRLFSR